jgi:hypothetical protein
MKRTLATLAIAAAAFASLPAQSASACTGPVCNAICDAWNSKLGQKVFGGPCQLG